MAAPRDSGNTAVGLRTRGLDIATNAKRQVADAARVEAKAVIERWNEQLWASWDMLWSPTIRAALIAGTPWLDVFCPGCGTSRAVDPLASVAILVLGLRCSWCPESEPMPRILGLHPLPPAAKAAASNCGPGRNRLPLPAALAAIECHFMHSGHPTQRLLSAEGQSGVVGRRITK
jgi:hypothetical protein